MSAADWRYQTHAKKYRIFSRVLLRFFQKLMCNTIVYMIKRFFVHTCPTNVFTHSINFMLQSVDGTLMNLQVTSVSEVHTNIIQDTVIG